MQLVDAATTERFFQSLQRCTSDPTFLQRFYARFLLSSDEVAAKFARVDIPRQSRILRTSLYLMCRAAAGFEDGLSHLREIATSHSRAKLDIGPHLYNIWLDCLVIVASETDPEFDDAVAQSWRATLQPCIAVMTETSAAP